MTWLLLACIGSDPSDPQTDPEPGDDTGTCTLCELETSTSYDCEHGETGVGVERALSAAAEGSTVTVSDLNFEQGCCPEFTARAVLSPGDGTLELVYSLENDFCDCICMLSLTTVVDDVPAGDWRVLAHGEETSVSVD